MRVAEQVPDDSCDLNVADIEVGAPHELGQRASFVVLVQPSPNG